MRRPLGFALALAGVIGCGTQGPAQPDETLDVSITRTAAGVRVVNDTGEVLGYAVWNPHWLGLFAPCVDATPGCPRLAPGETAVVALPDIVGYAPGIREVAVRWWRMIPDGAGGVRAGDVHEEVIAL